MTSTRSKSAEADGSGRSTEATSPSLQAIHTGDDFPALWQQAYNASPDMISILDTRHRIVSVNRAMAKALQRTPAEARGHYCYQIMHHSENPPLACPHRALLEDGREHHAEIYEERLNQWLLVSVTPVYGENDKLIGSIHIARDHPYGSSPGRTIYEQETATMGFPRRTERHTRTSVKGV